MSHATLQLSKVKLEKPRDRLLVQVEHEYDVIFRHHFMNHGTIDHPIYSLRDDEVQNVIRLWHDITPFSDRRLYAIKCLIKSVPDISYARNLLTSRRYKIERSVVHGETYFHCVVSLW